MPELANCMSSWWPAVRSSGVQMPKTIQYPANSTPLFELIEGKKPLDWDKWISGLAVACLQVSKTGPWFLRTGHTSNKHAWTDSCYVTDLKRLGRHVTKLVAFSEAVSLPGLPYDEWFVREVLPTKKLFTAFQGMPICREFQFFARPHEIFCHHFYWPPDSIQFYRGTPEPAGWREDLRKESVLSGDEYKVVAESIYRVASCLDGQAWSIDAIQLEDGSWAVTDMAKAKDSFHWPGCRVAGAQGWRS